MKGLKKFLFAFIAIAGCMLFTVSGVRAEKGKIEVEDDPNPDGVVGFSLPIPGEEEENPEEEPVEGEEDENPSDEGEEAGN